MSRVSACLLVIVAAAAGAGCKKKPPLRAEGHVVDGLSGKGLEGIRVTSSMIGGGDTVTTTTDGQGHFTLRGKFDADKPYQLKAEGTRVVSAIVSPAPRLPYKDPVRIEVLPNDLPNGFNVPVEGRNVKAPAVDAKVTLPPPDHPTAALLESLEAKDVPADIPKVVVGDKPVSTVLAPPTEKCECAVQQLVQVAGTQDWQTSGDMIPLETWNPPPGTIMPMVMMHVLELPPGKLAPGRWIFWPTKPPTYEEMARLMPKVYRQGYVFDVVAK